MNRPLAALVVLLVVAVLVGAGSWFVWHFALRADPGESLLAAGRDQEALAHYQRRVAAAPGDAGAYVGRGTSHLRLGEVAQAAADAEAALERNAELATAHELQARIALVEGDLKQAREHTNIALAFAPELARLYECRAALERDEGNVDRALDDLDAARQLARSSFEEAEYQAAKGWVYLNQGDYSGVLRTGEAAITIHRDQPLGYLIRGLGLIAIKNNHEAQEDFRFYRQLRPQEAEWSRALQRALQDQRTPFTSRLLYQLRWAPGDIPAAPQSAATDQESPADKGQQAAPDQEPPGQPVSPPARETP